MTLQYESPAPTNERRLLARLSRGGWAVADQSLFAAANFLLNILLARWLQPAAYGALSVALATIFLLGAMHIALLGEPLLVFGAGRFSDRPRAYLGAVLVGHWGVATVVLLVMVMAGAVSALVGSTPLAVALVGLGLGSPFILLLWLARRVCYLTHQPRRAAIAGMAYLILMTAGLALLRHQQWVTLPAALAVMAGCSAVVGGGLTVSLRPDFRAVNRPLLREVATAHLRYGRWSAATNAMIFLSGQAFYVLTAMLAGLEASGTLRAMGNFITPMNLVSAAMATLLVPALVRSTSDQHRKRRLGQALVLLTAAGLMYWLVLGILQCPLFNLLYGGRYLPPQHLIWVLGATLVTGPIADVIAAGLRASERPDLILWSFVIAGLIGLISGTVLIVIAGLSGAVVAMAVGSTIAMVGLVIFSVKVDRSS